MPDGLTASRMLLRLDADIAAASSPLLADGKRAERAAYLARLGRIDEAREALDELRQRYARGANAWVSAWIHLVEGIIAHCHAMHPSARQHVLRAHALAAAVGLSGLQALAAAWLAHLDYLDLRIDPMKDHLAESLRLSAAHDHGSRSRACLVMAQAYHFAGRFDRATPWYARSREHAASDGDDATLGALMHNMAWLKIQDLRSRAPAAGAAAADGGAVLLSADITAAFDALIGHSNLPSLVPILKAQIHTAQGAYAPALALFDRHLDAALRQGMGRWQSNLLSDRACCLLELGRRDEALAQALQAQAGIDPAAAPDERAMTHERLERVYRGLGESGRACVQAELGRSARAAHRAAQERIVERLASIG